jgi:hypothetical protein
MRSKLTGLTTRLRRLSPYRIGLLLEAAVLLAIARSVIFVLPFRIVALALNRPFGALRQTRERNQARKDIRWAVERGARCLPGETVCFPKGIAAHIMCRARGIESVLYYGALSSPAEGLIAHVWLKDGNTGIVGHSVAHRYSVLAQFPQSIATN